MVAVSFLGLLAGGCLARDPGVQLEDGGRAPGLHFTTTKIDIGADSEVTTLAGPNGLLLVCSHGGFGQPSPSWVSHDSGATWRRLDPQPNPVVSGDCDWAVMEDGAWAIVYDTLGSATVASTLDQGSTWAFNYVSAVPYGGVDRPWLASQGNDLFLAYDNVMAEEPAVTSLAISHDHGRTWEQHVAHTASADDHPFTVIGRPVVYGRTVRIPMASNDMAFSALGAASPTVLSFATSRDGGSSWTEERVAGPYSTYFQLPSADRAPDGTLFLTKPEGSVGLMALDVLVSRDDGVSWTSVHVTDRVSFPSVSGPWIDARPDGSATVAWMQQDVANGTRAVWAARVDAARVLIPATRLTEPVQDTAGYEFITVDHDASGRAFLAYPMDTGDCTRTTPVRPDRNLQCLHLLSEAT